MRIPLRRALLATTALLPATLAQAQAPNAAPTGGQVVAGAARITQGAGVTRIEQASDRAAIDWQRFDVGRDHTVRFQQPSAGSWTLNRVNSPDPSMIAGRIEANGGVAIVNRSGVVFGQGSQVNVGSLIASAAGITTQNFMAGTMTFDQPANPGARVENHGSITVADRGLAALAGPGSANRGVIRARLGRVALAGAETFALDLAGDGMLSLDVTSAVRQSAGGDVALVTNAGTITAQGGSVLLTANAAQGVVEALVRNTGSIAADAGQVALRGAGGGTVDIAAGTVAARGGRVEVSSAGGTARIAAGARADASGRAGGGTVQVGGATTRRVEVAGTAAARGTGPRAQGGRVTAQATDRVAVQPGGRLDASGQAGGGTVLAGTTGVGRNQAMARETVVAPGARLAADATARGRGGSVVVNSTTRTEMRGAVSARGVAAGGFVEVSGQSALVAPGLLAAVDVGATAGPAGTLLIDPTTIIIAAVGDPVAGDVAAGDAPATLTLDAAAVGAFAGDLLLEATRSIDVTAAIAKPDGDLTLRTTTGAGTGITLDAPVTLGAGTLALESGQGIVIRGAITAPDVRLTATRGDITQAAPIATGTLLVQADTLGSQTVVLDHAGNAVTTLAGRSSGGFTFTDADALTVGAVNGVAGIATSQGGSGITLRAGGALTVAGALSAKGAGVVALEATAGNITQTAAISGGSLVAIAATDAGQSVTLDHPDNAIGTLAGRAQAGFAFTDSNALTIGTVAGTTGVTVLDSAGGITLGSGGALAVNGALAAGALGDVALTATAGDVTQAASIAGRALLVLAESVNGQTVTLDHAGNAVAVLAGRSTGDFLYTDADALTVGALNGVAGIATTQAASGITLATGGALAVAGALQAGSNGTVSLAATAGDITQSAAITGNALRVLAEGAAGQRITLEHAGNDVGSFAARATGTVRYADASALTIGTIGDVAGVTVADAAAGITLRAEGTLTVEAPVVTAEGGSGSVAVTSVTGGVRNDSAIITAGDLTVRGATNVANRTAGSWLLAEGGRLVVQAGLSVAGGDAADVTGSLSNAGQIQAVADVAGSRVTATGALGNDGLIALWSGSGTAVGAVSSGGTLTQSATGRTLAGSVGQAGSALSNAGQIGTETLRAGTLTNTATGVLAVRGGVTVDALTNAGAATMTALSVAGTLGNTGILRVTEALVAGGAIVNGGAVVAETIRATTGAITNTGRLQAETVRAGTRLRNEGAGAVLRAGQVTTDTDDVVNNDGAALLAGGRGAASAVTLDVAGLADATGARAAALGASAPGENASAREGVSAPGAPVTLGALGGAVEQAGTDGAAGALRVTATAGRVVNQGGAAIIAGTTLDITAGAQVQNSGAGSWMLAEAGRLTVAGTDVTNGGQMVAADGTQANSAITATGTLTNSGTIAIWDGGGAARGAVRAGGALTNSGRILAGAVGQPDAALANTGRIAADSVQAAALTNGAAGWIAARGAITAGSLSNAGEVLAGSVATIGALSSSGTLRSAGAVEAGGALTQGGLLVARSVRAGGALTTTGTLQAETVEAGGTLRASGAGALLRATQLTTPGALEVLGGASVLAGSTSAGAAVTPVVTGAPTAAEATAAARAGTAPPALGLAASGGAVATPEGTPATGDLALRAAGLRIEGPVQAGGALRVTGDTLTAAGSGLLAAGTTLYLAPLTPGRTVQFGGDGPVAGRLVIGADVLARLDAGATALLLEASGSAILLTGIADLQGIEQVTLEGASITGASQLSAGETLTLSATGSVTLTGGTYTAPRMRVLAGPAGDATGRIALSDASFRIGTGLLLAAGGGVGTAGGGTSFVAGTQPGIDPLVIIETRHSATALRDLPAALTEATADQRGAAPNAQAWQVANLRNAGRLVFGRDDGSGAATRNAGGAVVLDLNAGTAPVFLLLDAGTATGTLEAGRLGVLGLPGGARAASDRVVDLGGRLGGLDGTPAAQFGRSSTIAAQDQTLYRINNCVLDTVTCVAVSFVQPVAAPVRNTIDIRQDVPRIAPDVLVPNIAEEDY